MTQESVLRSLVKAAEEVFEELGSGWSESVYHSALEVELSRRGIEFSSEATFPVMYRGKPVGRRRPDLVVSDTNFVYILELKAGSSSGEEQLEQYISLSENNQNIGELRGAALIAFNEELETSLVEFNDQQEDSGKDEQT